MAPAPRRDRYRIQVFAPDGTFARTWKTRARDACCPTDIALDGERNFFVLDDAWLPRVQVFRDEASPRVTALEDCHHSRVEEIGNTLTGIAIDSDGRVHVGDADNRRVLVFE